MLEEMVNDYTSYFKLDMSNSFQTVQDVIDNMLTRLEELNSVLQIIKSKNTDCSSTVSDDISKYRNEINTLSKKINTLNVVIFKLHNNVDLLEKQVEKAEIDFSVNNDNRIKTLFKPFLKKNKDVAATTSVNIPCPHKLLSVMDHFQSDAL